MVGAKLRVLVWVITIVGCLGVLLLSVWPGLLIDLVDRSLFVTLLLVLSFPLLFLLPVIALTAGAYIYWRKGMPAWRRWLAHLALMASVCVLTLGLNVLRVPMRMAFAWSRSDFEQKLAAAPGRDVSTKLNERLGAYLVDEYAKDERGGVYYRVFWGGDGLGPDIMSYGFAYQPNADGTPFGAAHYAKRRLTGDWYLFCASDDWF